MRRRNVKNAHERLVKNDKFVVLEPQKNKGHWLNSFLKKQPIYLEIGMGKGDFIIEQAKTNPQINFIGLEKYESVLVQAVEKAKNLELDNLLLVCYDATSLEELFDCDEITKIYLNFSDPWPKSRHEKRRLTSKNFLERYKKICVHPVTLEFKTDNQDLFAYSLKSLNNDNWFFEDLTFDLHQRDEQIIMTEYEKKFHSMGHNIYYVKAICNE